ncbi:polysaccharide deacetylase family protein [uncultured Massilia sp.]|uniref:polysaccharide deacetylase family protein n=1 Tax=uncultured Massilia sp. TaxID=169973 RepID=UPI00258F6D0B|nr:polysaccharide deacetylase family protein [uncultured Massilia sp.]
MSAGRAGAVTVRVRALLSGLLLGGALAGMGSAHAAEPARAFAWPNGARAAVSLAYDDALDSQLDHALPVLDRHGIRATFYLQLSNPAVAQRMAAWRAAARRGHELGNHSLFHQCARSKAERGWVEAHRDLDTTSAEQMRDQVLLANTMLMAIDGRHERTYTAPCGDTLAGGRAYLPGLHAAFVAIKVGSSDGVVDAMETLDPHTVPVHAPVGASGAQLIAIVKEAARRGTMVNFTFHGIGGDYLTVSSQAHEELVRFLAANRREYWTGTFLDIMRHVRREQARLKPAPTTSGTP